MILFSFLTFVNSILLYIINKFSVNIALVFAAKIYLRKCELNIESMKSVWKVHIHFEYYGNWMNSTSLTFQPIKGDLFLSIHEQLQAYWTIPLAVK